MNFNIDLNSCFKTSDIVVLNNTLLPESFRGDARHTRLCQEAVSVILDEMGEASAKAQGLIKPITSADRLRNSDHIIYLLLERDGNQGNGTVVGLLKMGRKSLYVFDELGDCHNQISLCVLDFYVHESRQRRGYGKMIFDFMLEREKIQPVKLAIDRPSEKFLSFLKKHYGLVKVIQQNNNFVVYSGFFNNKRISAENSPRKSTENSFRNPLDDPVTYNGRFTAHKPESTIGKEVLCLERETDEQLCSGDSPYAEIDKTLYMRQKNNSDCVLCRLFLVEFAKKPCLMWNDADKWSAQYAPKELYTFPYYAFKTHAFHGLVRK